MIPIIDLIITVNKHDLGGCHNKKRCSSYSDVTSLHLYRAFMQYKKHSKNFALSTSKKFTSVQNTESFTSENADTCRYC